jgi:hypothetical protein
MHAHLPVLGAVTATIVFGACAPRPIAPSTTEATTMNAPPLAPASKRDAISGIARDAKAGAVLVQGDGRVVYVAGLSAWPADVVGRRIRGTGTLVVASRLPRATQDESGAWSQGVAGDSTGETWLDDAQWAAEGPDAAPWTVTLSDGAGNVTTITQPQGGPVTWRYRPVTPAESSTGFYSGGDPASGTLAPAQVDALWTLVRAARGEPADQGRDKGTFLVEVASPNGPRAVVVQRSDATDLDAWARALRAE